MTELILNGVRRVASRQWPGWARAITETEECGYHRMAGNMRAVQGSSHKTRGVFEMLKLLALARDALA